MSDLIRYLVPVLRLACSVGNETDDRTFRVLKRNYLRQTSDQVDHAIVPSLREAMEARYGGRNGVTGTKHIQSQFNLICMTKAF